MKEGRIAAAIIFLTLLFTTLSPISLSSTIHENPITPMPVGMNPDLAISATPAPGYTLFTPYIDTNTFLIDNMGNTVISWPSTMLPRQSVYMRENGNIIRASGDATNDFEGVEEYSWNGSIVWSYNFERLNDGLHHDIEPMPNGNVLLIARTTMTRAETLDAGRDPAIFSGIAMTTDYIVEIQPTGPTTGQIVWEWHTWDHLIQDYSFGADNYGIVSDNPGLIDINFPYEDNSNLEHFNSVDYNEEFDQIVISARTYSEFWVIDHNTTTEEAAGHTGGAHGKGGDVLYRWGNPQAYDRGTQEDQKIFLQHDVHWIPKGYPGEGNFLLFNNQIPDGEGGLFSSVDELVSPMDENGDYPTLGLGEAYEPSSPIWRFMEAQPTDFYVARRGSAQRLHNGNTLICNSSTGFLFEVTPLNQTIWSYQNTYPSLAEAGMYNAIRYDSLPYTQSLSPGWNLISLPFVPKNESLSDILRTIDGKWDRVYTYDASDADHWKSNNTAVPFNFNELEALDHRVGIWININEDAEFTYWGNISMSTQIELKSGWNLVGYPSFNEQTVAEALAGTGYDRIEGFSVASPYVQQLGDSYLMKPGEGYWVHVPSDTIWVVDWN